MSTLNANGQTDTLYLRSVDTSIEYKINDDDWGPISMPLTIINIDTSATLHVLFPEEFVVSTISTYITVGSDNIQFGSTSLDALGGRTSLSVDTVLNYGGLIGNGTSGGAGFNSIYIYNIYINTPNSPTLAAGGGWLGRAYFGRDAINNYFINCSTDGNIPSSCGGIVGQYCAYKDAATTTSLTLIGCSTLGEMTSSSGGIVGNYAATGSGANCYIQQCWSEGVIGTNAGGIAGTNAASQSGYIQISKCYSLGAIAGSAGGICGINAGNTSGSVSVENSYSRGTTIGTAAGGIYGQFPGINSGIVIATNCYSVGTITTTGTGIFGSGGGTPTASHCYIANGTWTSASANLSLQGIPTSGNVGTVWVIRGINQAYELVNLGATPYQEQNISNNQLIQSYSQTIGPGDQTDKALMGDASGNVFTIEGITGGDSNSYGTIKISVQTAAISTSVSTAAGNYTVYVRSVGSYFITIFFLTVTGEPESSTATCCVTTFQERGVSYEWMNQYKIGNVLLVEQSQKPPLKFNDYSEYVKYKMAQGSRKF